MKKNKVEPSVPKLHKSIEVRVVLPWVITSILISLTVGLIAGWFVHSNAVSSVSHEAVQVLKDINSN
jgi:hypothetical protein